MLDRCVEVLATVAMTTNEDRDVQERCNNAHCVQCHGDSQQIFPISVDHITVFQQPKGTGSDKYNTYSPKLHCNGHLPILSAICILRLQICCNMIAVETTAIAIAQSRP